jgi:hypothetical protein
MEAVVVGVINAPLVEKNRTRTNRKAINIKEDRHAEHQARLQRRWENTQS